MATQSSEQTHFTSEIVVFSLRSHDTYVKGVSQHEVPTLCGPTRNVFFKFEHNKNPAGRWYILRSGMYINNV